MIVMPKRHHLENVDEARGARDVALCSILLLDCHMEGHPDEQCKK